LILERQLASPALSLESRAAFGTRVKVAPSHAGDALDFSAYM
jgi:hypothetical protein